jgi:dTDP-4-dehydrorhamnose reductase
MMRILITGSKGQLGYELLRCQPENYEVCPVDIDELDITDLGQVEKLVNEFQPRFVINGAAYTAVDRAEAEPEKAFAVNSDGAWNLAKASGVSNSRMIHVSTDFVFDGSKGSPWTPSDSTSPLGIYGKSKLEGEERVRRELKDLALVLRTSWLYSAHGNNFVKTMLRLMQEKEFLGVVSDQIGSPTWANTLARAIWRIIQSDAPSGIFHWSDAGAASWYDFALAIQEEAIQAGLLKMKIPIHPIRTSEYPTPARRPSNSVLDQSSTWETFDLRPTHWRQALRDMLRELALT